MNELTKPEKLMTIKEIASVLNVTERTIQLKAKELFPDKIKNGVTTRLNQSEVTLIKIDLEKKFEVKTQLEKALLIQQAMTFQQEMIADLKIENEMLIEENKELKPKAEFYDTVTQSDQWLDMRTAAGLIHEKTGMGRNNLMKFLKEQKILSKNRMPLQPYIDHGYFRPVERSYIRSDGFQGISIKPVVSQKGLDFIVRLINKQGNNE